MNLLQDCMSVMVVERYERGYLGSRELLRQIELELASGSDVQSACRKVGIKPIQIYPGSPWETGYNERFTGALRREVLNAEWFATVKQVETVIYCWLKQYNHIRPHQALNMRPPVPETPSENGP